MLSFVVPVFNEERHIGGILRAIQRVAAQLPHELIVVDNGSSDRSLEIAESLGATCFRRQEMTIAGLRNFGASRANGEVLVFIDADVYIQDNWGSAIGETISTLRRNEAIITGSHCRISRRPSWIEKHWTAPFANRTHSGYINSGHLIVRQSFFEEIGRFAEDLETGEDYDLCQRSIQAGGAIVNNLDLEVIHEGNPRTLTAFFRRERWHGRGDAINLAAILASKPATLALLQVIALALAVMTASAFRSAGLLLLFPALAVPIWIGSAFHRCRRVGLEFWIDAALYAVYFAARAAAIFDVLLRRPSARRSGAFAGRTGNPHNPQ